jgi:hypothetical protein
MPAAMSVLWTVCAVVGAVVLYCAVMAGLWTLAVRLVRRVGAATRSRQRAGPALVSPASAPTDPANRRAKGWGDLPGWLSRDRPWAVAVVLLGAPPIRDRTAAYIDFPARRIDWPGLLTGSTAWRADERLLVLTAYDLATDSADAPSDVERALSEPVTLADVVRLLDDDQVERVRVAMDVRRGRVEVGEALTRLTG